MSGGERLDRGDAGDDVVIDVDVRSDGFKDPQRAVVERRIAPREERTDAARFQFGLDRIGPHTGPSRMPVGDGLPVGRTVRSGPSLGGSGSATNR